MKWRLKAIVQTAVAALPGDLAYGTYYQFQRVLGTLRKSPLSDLRKAVTIANLARQHGTLGSIVEIGTGRSLSVPIGLYLCGAEQILTVDANPYLKEVLVMADVAWMRAHRAETPGAPERLTALLGSQDLRDVMATLRLEYCAPADAASLQVAAGCMDLHTSTNVLEHVAPDTIRRLLVEARRVLKPTGLFVHRIDLSDHFSHSDGSISPINFLQFSERQWHRWAGNRFMYQNRLRAPEFARLFADAGLDVLFLDVTVDPRALRAVQEGLRLDPRFAGYTPEELATTFLTVVGRFK